MTPKVHRYIRKLKQDFPLRFPVSVRTYPKLVCVDGKTKLHGTCEFINGKFRISLSRKCTESEMIDTLWHEWAHCLLWPRCKFRHTKRFAEQYFAIYRKYLD